MGQVSNSLRKVQDGYAHWCDGCAEMHVVYTAGHIAWSFNGDVERPSFTPSVRHTWTEGPAHESRCCHYFITDGNIAFCGDCTHALSGKTVPLPALPDHLQDNRQ